MTARTAAPFDMRPVADPEPGERHVVDIARTSWHCVTGGCGSSGVGATVADARRAADDHANPATRRRDHDRDARFWSAVADDSRQYAPLIRALHRAGLVAEVAHTGGGCLAVYVGRSDAEHARPFVCITDLDGPWHVRMYASLDASYDTQISHAVAYLAHDIRPRAVAALALAMIDGYRADMGGLDGDV